jgi:hypothetical protein
MADLKTTELDAITSLNDADLLYAVSDVSTTPLSKKITVANAKTSILSGHTQDTSTILINGVNTPSYDDLLDFLGTTQSSGRISGGVITAKAPADGSVDISDLQGMIHIADSVGAELKFVKVTGANLALTDNALNYIYVDYNAGTPIFATTTDRTTISEYDNFTIGRAYRQGTTTDIVPSGTNIYNGYRRIHNRLVKKYGFDWASGATLSESDTRKLAVTDGIWYVGNTEIDTTGFDTNVSGSFSTYYTSDSGSTWTKTDSVTQMGNTQYNAVASGLATLDNNKYANYWVYMCPQGSLYVVYGQAQYTSLAEAQATQSPSLLPNYITANTRLISRITFQKGATNFASVSNAHITAISASAVTLHNNLGNLAWGSSGHTGTASTIAGFAAVTGVAAEYTLSGTGTVLALATSPSFTTPTLGAASATSINKVALTAPANGSTLTIADAKTLTCNNTLTLTATDGSTLAIGTGGTLGTGAYATIANYATLANPTFTGTVILPKTIEIQDTSADHQYVLAVSELTGDRTITLPLLTGTDTFVFNAHTATLTNKRITKRVTALTSHATPTINTDDCDCVDITALAEAITNMSTNLSGTPTNKQQLIFEIKDNGTARAISWGTSFVAGGVALPTTTVLSKILTVGFMYSTANALNKWRCIASTQEV